MNVMLTGPFGNIGTYTIDKLLARGHNITCFDIRTKKNINTAAKYCKNFKEKIKVVWGDLRTGENLIKALEGIDAVIHLAFVIPPASERNLAFSHGVNIIGTSGLIATMKEMKKPPLLIFTSSIAVYGLSQDLTPPRKITDSVKPLDHYGHQKVECEHMIMESGLEWVILRLAAAPSIDLKRIDPIMFDVPLTDRIEFVHPADIASALANAIESDDVRNKLLLIGGGEKCQMYQREFMRKSLAMLGIDMLPDSAFGTAPYHTDWMDTAESENMLKYQKHTFDEFLKEQAGLFGIRVFFMKLFRPLIRFILLRNSPYYNTRSLNLSEYEGRAIKSKSVVWKGKIALITGASSGIGAAAAKRLAVEGIKVVLTARRKDKLETLAAEIIAKGGQAFVVTGDLSDEKEILRILEEIHAKYGQIDILINNAGFGWYGYFSNMPWSIAWDMIKVNIAAASHLTMLVIPEMLKRGNGSIINIGSIAGNLPSQGIALYSATKAFLDAFTKSLWREMKGKKIHIGLIKPGPVKTEFFDSACSKYSSQRIPAEKFGIKAEFVADKIWNMVKKRRKSLFIPSFLWIVPFIEFYFGWLINCLGPLLLRKKLKFE